MTDFPSTEDLALYEGIATHLHGIPVAKADAREWVQCRGCGVWVRAIDDKYCEESETGPDVKEKTE